MDERAFNPALAEDEQQHEQKQIDACHNTECAHLANGWHQRVGYREREVDEHQDEQNRQHCRDRNHRQQPDNLLYDVKLGILRLQPDIVLDYLHQLPDGLYVLIIGKHGTLLSDRCCVFDVVNEIVYFLP